MQAIITIPQGWAVPRLGFGNRTQLGQIIGLRYYPFDSYLAYEYGEGWRYTIMPDKHSEDEVQFAEDEVVLLTPQELKAQIEAEITKKMQEIELLTKELLAIPTNNL